MPWMLPAAIVGSAILGSSSARQAGSAQADAAAQATGVQRDVSEQQIALQREQFNKMLELQAPFREVGLRALGKLEGASEYTPFGMKQFQADPGYAFRLSEGMKALNQQAAARGGLMSGNALRAAQQYGQDLGSQEYQNAFNRYQAERQARLGPLQSLAGVGQTSTQAIGQAGESMASNIGNALGAYGRGAGEALGAAGQARASAYMGQANAITGGLNQYLNYQNQQQQNALLQNVLGGNRYFGYSGG
jgi:hypothetical protein